MKEFLKSSKKRNVFKRTICYGLISVTEKYDIMSASISLANYFASAKGYSTALVICEENEAVLHMLSEKRCVDVEPTGYADKYLTYYCVSGSGDLRKLKNKSFDRIVLEMETVHLDEDMFREIDELRFFADIYPWHYHEVRMTYRQLLAGTVEQRQWNGEKFYTEAARKSDKDRLKQEFGIGMIETGFFKDPYRLGKTDLIQVEKIL